MRLLLSSLLCFVSMPAGAITLTVTDATIPSSVLGTLDQAGEYFGSSTESNSTAASVSVGSAPNTPAVSNSECGATDPAWKLVAQVNTDVSGLTLRVKRTSNGTGGTVYGGESYTTLSAFPTTLFCGNSDVSDINLQFQVDALDTGDGYGTKTWQIDYSVETL